MKRIGVLASGRGSNLQALIAAAASAALGPAQLVLAVSDRPGAPALDHARRAGLPACVCEPGVGTRAEHETALAGLLGRYHVDLLCLAGYMRLLSPGFVERFPGPILNVHPSLLPAFPGLDAQRQAWEHGVKVSGATVHFVDAGLDSGPIIAQEAVPVRSDDTVETLAARILEAEHRLYPSSVRLVAAEGYRLVGRRVCLES